MNGFFYLKRKNQVQRTMIWWAAARLWFSGWRLISRERYEQHVKANQQDEPPPFKRFVDHQIKQYGAGQDDD